jgi:methionine sulfoxide reductase heme-binding subunit
MDIAGPINTALRRVPPVTIYLAAGLWGGWLFWQAATGAIGVEPVNILERAYGLLALKFLIAGLAVTPLRKWTGINLIRFRRAIGVTCFFFVLAHFLVWALLDVQSLARVWADIVKRPYITIGMGAFLLLIPLAVTSNNLAVRKMGAAAWKRLHKLTYPAAVLGALHFVWLVKGWPLEPFIYLGLVLGLLLARVKWPTTRVVA